MQPGSQIRNWDEAAESKFITCAFRTLTTIELRKHLHSINRESLGVPTARSRWYHEACFSRVRRSCNRQTVVLGRLSQYVVISPALIVLRRLFRFGTASLGEGSNHSCCKIQQLLLPTYCRHLKGKGKRQQALKSRMFLSRRNHSLARRSINMLISSACCLSRFFLVPDKKRPQFSRGLISGEMRLVAV